MRVSVRKLTGWEEALRAARMTVWKPSPADCHRPPSERFIRESLLSEHSHIREVTFAVEIEGMKSWIATHFVRHHIGIEKYVATQRDDRRPSDTPRDELPQGALVNVRFTLNAQAFLSISHRRLCHAAHRETRMVWVRIVAELRKVDPILAEYCVPSCVYRGFCPERPEQRDICGLNWMPWRSAYLDHAVARTKPIITLEQ